MIGVCEPNGDLPDLGPDAYRRWRTSDVGATTERLERQLILNMLGNVDGRRVLDVGCGDGELACELAARGAIVTGIDSSVAMIEAAKSRAARQRADIAFQVSTAQNLPFRDDQFDVVTAITILCFVKNAAPIFQEIARVLQPGGRCIVGELGKWSTWAAVRRVRAWLGSQLWRMARFRTAGELRRCAEQAGLTVESLRGAIFYPRSKLAARLLSRFDLAVGRHITVGAAFLALSAGKPGDRSHHRGGSRAAPRPRRRASHGRFHLLFASTADVTGIIQAFRRLGVKKVAPSHCTGDSTRNLQRGVRTRLRRGRCGNGSELQPGKSCAKDS